jgi:predicted ester cyclase
MPTPRTQILAGALRIGLTGDVENLAEYFTEDVVGWSPNLSVSSLAELREAYSEREDAFSDIEFEFDAVETPGDRVIAEWRVAGVHTGPFVIDEDLTIEATGHHLVLAGATFAEFRGDKIAVFRSYFDDAALLEQMLAPD